MLEADPGAKKEVWRRDLKQIKALGFNAVRCWIDWASGEPAPGQYRLDTLDVLLSLAEEEGLKVVVQVYMDSAPEWVGRQHPDSFFVSSNGQAIRPESSPGYCMDHPGVRKADLAFYEAVARRAGASPAFLGFDLWSEPHVINWANPTYIDEPRVLLLPEHGGALPRVAEEEVRHARGAERGVVPPARVVGRGRAEPAQHDPLLHGLRRLEALHRRQARGGPARAVRGGQARRPRPRRHEPRRRRRPLLLAALLGGPVRRLDDGRPGGPLRDVLLPEALGLRGPGRRVAGGAPRLRPLVRLRAGRARASGSASCRRASARSPSTSRRP